MTWRVYELIFRLRSPMHIGWKKGGNLQITQPYATGRVFWGALTARLTRDKAHGPATDSTLYQDVSQQVHQCLAYTYFYPATRSGNTYQIAWPWEDESRFRYRFLGSYASTALTYPQQSTDEGMLHEVEFISPNTVDTGEPVFLIGYVFEKDGNSLCWKKACQRLQLGGERGYGWGAVELVSTAKINTGRLFDGTAEFLRNGNNQIRVKKWGRLLAHTVATGNISISGSIEPLVGREWRPNEIQSRYVGQYVKFNDICFICGSVVNKELDFVIGKFGVWRCLVDQA